MEDLDWASQEAELRALEAEGFYYEPETPVDPDAIVDEDGPLMEGENEGIEAPQAPVEKGKENQMAPRTRTTKSTATKVAAKATKAAGELAKPANVVTEMTPDQKVRAQKLTPCLCGCGELVPRMFRQGHDARLKGKIIRAEVRMEEDGATVPDWNKFGIPKEAVRNLDHLFKGRFMQYHDPKAEY